MPTTTPDKRLFRSITLRNILSFGDQTAPLPLENLNVLIGPNGSGKSNLLECIALLRATPTDPRKVMSGKGGGVGEWIWKGQPDAPASIDAVLTVPHVLQPLRHVFAFRKEQYASRLTDERIENESLQRNGDVAFNVDESFYQYRSGQPWVSTLVQGERIAVDASTDLTPASPIESMLSRARSYHTYPEMTNLADAYERIRLYRDWPFGRNTIFRSPQQADLRTDRLEEDFSNLALFLNKLRRHPKAKAELLTALRDLYEGLTDFDVSIEGNTVQVFFMEGDFVIPATRLSDGSLRYLCLLAILCDPDPPPFIGIEEPELGLHPDLQVKIADLLVKASERTQLLVTTHSDILIDALSEKPESVIVCEKHEGSTTMNRLDPVALADWLKTYRLGELWTRGNLGGNRW